MTKTNKMTKRDYFSALLNMAEVKANPEMVKFVEHELELLAKKNSADKKPTAQQIANKAYEEAILEYMESDRLYTITELLKGVPALASSPDMTNQRVSAIVRLMGPEKVKRTEDKRKAYFSKVIAE